MASLRFCAYQYFTDMVGRFRETGTDEFVLYWPLAWREQPTGGDFHARELSRMLQMLHGDAVSSQCEGLGHAAAALGRRVNEYTGRNVPDAAFFREVPRMVEHMYTHLDDFREGKIKPYQENIDAGTEEHVNVLPSFRTR